jgi:hypothetical protein
MNSLPTVAINFGLNDLIFYAIGRKLGGHRTGVRLGLIGGIVSALAALYIGTKSEDSHD